MAIRILFGLFVAFIRPTLASAAPAHVPTCPPTYPNDGVALTKVPQGWKGEVYERFSLSTVSVATEPDHEGEIIPTSKPLAHGAAQVTYDGLGFYSRERWLVCIYGYGQAVRLYQRLPSNIQRCTVTYTLVKGTKSSTIDKYQCE